MKKLLACTLAIVLAGILTGCLSKEEPGIKPNIDVHTESITREKETTKATTTVPTNKDPSITKGKIDKKIETKSTFKQNGTTLTGTLCFQNSGFVFTPDTGGEEVTFPMNTILLVFVSYEMESEGEILSLLTATEQIDFTVEDGYANDLSKYILISEAA